MNNNDSIPPVSNIQRAALAEQTLYRYSALRTGAPGLYEERKEVICDLLTDLMHLSRLQWLDFMQLLAEAEHYFFVELAEENGSVNEIPPPAGVANVGPLNPGNEKENGK